MTVAELIEQLEMVPSDWIVDIYGPTDRDGLGAIHQRFTLQWGGGEVNNCIEDDE